MAQIAIGSGLNPAPGGAAGAGSGTVTSVNASLTFATSAGAVTTSGTIALTWDVQGAGKFLIGPASGPDAAPTFRVAVASDIPALPYAATAHTHAASDITSGQVALARGGTNADLSATGGAGHVLKQASAGAAVTVGALAQADISGLGTSDSPQFAAVNIGHASDSTVTRSAAGKLAVEGKAVPLMSGAVDLVLAGPTAARTWTGPDADATLLYSGGALGTPSSGTLTNATGLPGAGVLAPVVTGQTDGATITIDASTFPSGQLGYATVTLAGNRTLTWSNGTVGQKIELIVTQDGTGSRTLAYTAATCKFSATIPSPTLSTTAAKRDRLLWECASSGVFLLIGVILGADV